jgi:HAMP domain-containing protein
LPGGYHLLVGRITSHLVAMEDRIAITLDWGLGLMLVLGSVVGWWMSQRMAQRIEAINRTNRDIISGDMSRRIPLQGTKDFHEQKLISPPPSGHLASLIISVKLIACRERQDTALNKKRIQP